MTTLIDRDGKKVVIIGDSDEEADWIKLGRDGDARRDDLAAHGEEEVKVVDKLLGDVGQEVRYIDKLRRLHWYHKRYIRVVQSNGLSKATTDWEEGKHPRTKGGEFAPKGEGTTARLVQLAEERGQEVRERLKAGRAVGLEGKQPYAAESVPKKPEAETAGRKKLLQGYYNHAIGQLLDMARDQVMPKAAMDRVKDAVDYYQAEVQGKGNPRVAFGRAMKDKVMIDLFGGKPLADHFESVEVRLKQKLVDAGLEPEPEKSEWEQTGEDPTIEYTSDEDTSDEEEGMPIEEFVGDTGMAALKPVPGVDKPRTHARHLENTQVFNVAREHFNHHAERVLDMMRRQGAPFLGDVKQAREMWEAWLGESRDVDPKAEFNDWMHANPVQRALGGAECDRIVLNVRNMYYKKLRAMKLDPKMVNVAGVVGGDTPPKTPSGNPILSRSPESIKDELELCNKLSGGDIETSTEIGGGHANAVYKVHIRDDGDAAMKPITRKGTYGMPHNEVFVYQVSAKLGFGIVPTTTYRRDKYGKLHSLQAWMPNAKEGIGFSEAGIQLTPEVQDSFSKMAVMDVALMNRDRNLGNWCYDKGTGRIVAIDNGLCGLEVGRGDMDRYDVFKSVQYHMGKVMGKIADPRFHDVSLDPRRWYSLINEEHIKAAEQLVNSPEFESMVRGHFSHQDFVDEWEEYEGIKNANPEDYVKRTVDGARGNLDKLRHLIEVMHQHISIGGKK